MAAINKAKDKKRVKLHVKKGDTVVVIAGKQKGENDKNNWSKTYKVIMALPQKSQVVVEKVNMIKRHTKPSKALPQGGIIEKEAPIHVSNVMLYCPECKRGRRCRIEIQGKGKDKVRDRVCSKCGSKFPEKSQ